MGMFDWASQANDWVKNRWNEDWDDFGKTFTESWSSIPDNFLRTQAGIGALVSAPFRDDGDFWGAARLTADSSLGMAGGALGGTLGTVFQAPILHEAAWLLDRAYRYGIARPIATPMIMSANNELEAYEQGLNSNGTFFDYMTDWNNLKKAWNDSEYVTPGQASVYLGSMGFQSATSDYDEAMKWATANNPRTPEGQLKYNSADADTWLKYGSGSLDFLTNIIIDPGHGATKLAQLGKLRLIDKTADSRYILAGKVQNELSTTSFDKVFDTARSTDAETFRDLAMPQAIRGGQMGMLLWTAANRYKDDPVKSKGLFADVWLTTRAFDPAAAERLSRQAPDLASEFMDMFANFTISDWDFQRGQLASSAKGGADALKLRKLDAFVDSLAGREGLWGQALGIGVGEKMPKIRTASKVRQGYHNFVLRSAPVIVGRPFQNLLTSQGHTRMIDANDNTAFSLRQFKANIERSTTRESPVLSEKEINGFTARYGAATSDATRHMVSIEAENLIVERMLLQSGLKEADLHKVLRFANETRDGARSLVRNSKIYISDLAARRAGVAAEAGDMEMAHRLEQVSKDIKEDGLNGGIDEGIAMSDVSGRMNFVPVSQYLPMLRSQFTEAIVMMDYRALRASIRWYNIVHPKPKYLPDPDDAEKFVKQDPTRWQTAFAKAAKARGWYQRTITALDAVSSMWKATTLLRPAQAPRNVASDTLLTMIEFGKLPLLMAAAQGPFNALRNFATWRGDQPGRVRLWYDVAASALARNQANGTTTKTLSAEVAVSAPGNVDTVNPQTGSWQNMGNAYANGQVSLIDYSNFLEELFSAELIVHSKKKPEQPKPARTKDLVPQLFTPTATRQMVQENIERTGRTANVGQDAAAPPQRARDRVDQAIGQALAGNETMGEGSFGPLQNPEVFPGIGERKSHPEGFKEKRIEVAPKEQKHDLEPLPYKPGEKPDMESYGFPVRRRGGVHHGEPVAAPYMPHRVGAPYFIEYVHWKEYKRTGDIDRFRRNISAQALSAANRAIYRQQKWGLGIVDDLLKRHINRRSAPDYQDNPYAPGTLVVHPFTGTQPYTLVGDLQKNFDITMHTVLQTRDVAKKKKGSVGSVAKNDIRKQMVAWVDQNADELLIPGNLMSMRVKPDGNIAIGIATAKKELLDAGETISPGARSRLTNFRYKGIRDMGHTGFEFKDAAGNVLMRLDGWAEGDIGAQFQARVSTRDNPSTQAGNLVNQSDAEDLMDQYGPQHNIAPGGDGYDSSWERAVNAQIASDPVAQRFLQRKADGQYRDADDIYTEIISTAWGTKWMHAMSFRGVAMMDLIQQIGAMVDTYIPAPGLMDDAKTKALHNLRARVRSKTATYADFENLYRNDDGSVNYVDMPQIHGPSVEFVLGNKRTWKTMRQTVRTLQKIVSDMPVDKAARFPFMAMAYQRHGAELARIAAHHFPDGPLPAETVNMIKNMALEKAYHDTRYRLYDTAQANDIASATRLLMPFSAAMMDGYIKYGRVVRENPVLLVQGAYYWDMFERNEMVQDENGYIARIEEGSTRWYRVDPKTGERTLVPDAKVGKHRYIQFQMPTELGKLAGQKYYGVDANPVFAVNKDTMNVFLNLPSGGPLVAFSANEFALSNPEFGEDKFTKQFLLPYGPSTNRTRALVPSTVRSSWEAFLADDGDRAQGHAAAIMQAELTGYALGTRNAPPTFEEVREKAASLRNLRFMATFFSPATFNVTSPYQPYIDSYRQLLADPETQDKAAEEFLRRNGDEFFAVMMSVTRNNAGLSATLESSKAYDKYADMIQQYPEFGGLIVGEEGAGEFAKSVYESQKETPVGPGDTRTLRELLSLRDSTENVQSKLTWIQYGRMMDLITASMVDQGLRTLRSRGADQLRAQRDAFVEKNRLWTNPGTGKEELSPWYLDYMSSDRGRVEKKFAAFGDIVKDERLQEREDIRGLAQYMSLRRRMRQEMQYWGFKSLDSQQATGLRNKWEQQVQMLVEQNTAFASLWNRWLSTDDKLDIAGPDDGTQFDLRNSLGSSFGFNNPASPSVRALSVGEVS